MNNRKFLVALVLAVTFLAFLPSLNNKFTNWDDDYYVLNNGTIKEFSLQNTVKIFTESYLPLTIFSYNLEYTFFKLNPFFYHLNNLLLHLFNCALVFYFILLLCEKPRTAFITALLFGIHPMHVESVAWIAERKDVLYASFFLLSLISYLQYRKSKSVKYYYLALVGFALSFFSKAMAVTLPFVLLLIDYYQDKSFDKKSFPEKIPFFILALIFGIAGFLMEKTHGAVKLENLSAPADNMLKGIYSLGFYLYKLLVPLNLSNIYSYPAGMAGMLPLLLFPALAGITVIVLKNKVIKFGAMFFAICILPVLQLLPFGVGVFADRYTYLPSIGLFFLAGHGLEKLREKNDEKINKLLSAGVVIVFVLLGVLTFVRCFAWYDGEAIWTDALKKDNNSKIAIHNLSVLSFQKGDYDKALLGFTRALQLDPGFNLAYSQRAQVYISLGDFTKARKDIAQIISNNPKAGESCQQLYELCDRMESKEKRGINREEALVVEEGRSCLARGNYKEAIIKYTKALTLSPGNPEYLNNRGVASSAINDNLSALKDYDAAIKAMNNEALPEYYFNRGNIFRKLGEQNEAVADYTRAIKKESGKSDYYNNRGISYYSLKDYKRALNDFEQAVILNPGNKSALKNRDTLIQKSNPIKTQ